MAKITIYLPDEIERKARNVARKKRVSVSRWLADQVKRSLDDRWPPEFLEAAGSCRDFPDSAELRSGYGRDARRESFD
jgi:hypothetical protein